MEEKGVIFLDVDGVLISLKHQKMISDRDEMRKYSLKRPVDWYCMGRFAKLVTDTSSDIVLVSGWRKYEEGIRRLKQLFSFYQIEQFYQGETEYSIHKNRTEEIQDYLKDHFYSHIVLLDDMIQPGMENYQVFVNRQIGLSEKDVYSAKKILKKEYFKR